MFFIILFFTGDKDMTTNDTILTAIAFVVGAIVSICCGAIGMLIATQTNFRTTYCAKKSLADAFRVAYRAGCAMGFALVSLGLLSNLFIYSSPHDSHSYLQVNQGP
jgi:K(+)-stimulated pyrophosphate-energized sodium pump